jgi:hypothetical protein
MEHVYELGVWVADDDAEHTYEMDHRFPALPELETVVALKREAVAAFQAIHEETEASQVNVRCNFLDAEERGEKGDRDEAEVR